MRTKALLFGDIRFQFKYGFYFMYLIFTVIYIALLYALPAAWREQAGVLMIFSDPAAMGLYFMGAIVLFEKSQQVLNSIAISPVKPLEYTAAKLISLAVISTAVGFLIGICSGIIENPLYFFAGVFLGSCLFSAVGLIVALNISTLNAFIVATIPAEILINVPAIAWLFGWKSRWMLLHPGVCIIELCNHGASSWLAVIVLTAWTVTAVLLAGRCAGKSLQSLGGVKI